MKTKKDLIIALFQIIIGLTAIISFIIVALNGENMLKWIITLIFAILFLIVGIIDLVQYIKSKKQTPID